MFVRLVPVEGGDAIELDKDLSVVGRKEDCDVRLNHRSISKQHCILVRADGLLLLRDLGSTNGTRVNGQRVRRAALLPNDQLNLASLKYRVEFDAGNKQDEGYTQHLDADEVAKLVKGNDDKTGQDIYEFDGPPIQTNVLPDAYPTESKQDSSVH